MVNKYLNFGFKNSENRPDIENIVLSNFLGDKIIQLFGDQQKIHQQDLANLFFQKVRFNRQFLLAGINFLIKKDVIFRPPRSSYFLLKRSKGGTT